MISSNLICHIDQQLVDKIRKGEYVELSKLLQKPEHLKMDDESKINLLTKDGEEYLVRNRSNQHLDKITNVRKWEQAFRTYTAIYCEANPSRSLEILQYVDVINQAASKFPWESVARYDFVFRQLMSKKPYRSWAKTLHTRLDADTVSRRGDSIGLVKVIWYRNSPTHGPSGTKQVDWRDNCCWKFNKTDNCPYGRNCRYEHRCTYCGGYGHPSVHCSKKVQKELHTRPR